MTTSLTILLSSVLIGASNEPSARGDSLGQHSPSKQPPITTGQRDAIAEPNIVLEDLNSAIDDHDLRRLRDILLSPEYCNDYLQQYSPGERADKRKSFDLACALMVASLDERLGDAALPTVVEYCYGATNSVPSGGVQAQITVAARRLVCGSSAGVTSSPGSNGLSKPQFKLHGIRQSQHDTYTVNSSSSGLSFVTEFAERNIHGKKVWVPVRHTVTGLY